MGTASDPYEPFRLAQGYRAGDFLFISGQAAIDASGRIVGLGDFDAQAQQAFENLDRVLRAGGSSLKNVIKVTIFLTDMSNFDSPWLGGARMLFIGTLAAGITYAVGRVVGISAGL